MRLWTLAAVLTALALFAVACQDADGGGSELEDVALKVGDCLFYAASDDIRPVYCFDPHHAEVIDVLTMPDGPYPGDNGVNRFAIDNCPDATDTFVYPTVETWAVGDRAIACLEEDLEEQP